MHYKTLAVSALAATVSAQTPSLTDLLKSQPDLSNLTTFVTDFPDLVQTLTTASNITIFAPTNEAFAKVLASPAGAQLMANPSLIEPILQYHVLSSLVFADEITSTPAFPKTLLTNATYTNVTGGQVVDAVTSGSNVNIVSGLLAKSNVVTPNVNFTGGVVHVIDTVLTIPESLGDTATAEGLTSAADALTKTNLLSVVEGLKDVTVFVPNNAAFAAIASTAATLTTDQLANILEYHVINGTVAYSSTLKDGEQVPTVQGGSVTISLANGGVKVNNANVVTPDVLIANGVVHVIDAVLMPSASNSSTSSSGGSSPTASGSGTGSGSPTATGSSTGTGTGVSVPTFTGAASAQHAAVGSVALFGLGALVMGAM